MTEEVEENKNPNLNDNGHTIYPKYVYPEAIAKHVPGQPRNSGILVANAKEEAEVMKGTKPSGKAPGWDK